MRWKHEAVIERIQQRLDQLPQAGRLRRQTVEHLRHAQIMDGSDALPDETTTRRANGDELAGPRIQPEASHAESWAFNR
jgi:hypothetical protein